MMHVVMGNVTSLDGILAWPNEKIVRGLSGGPGSVLGPSGGRLGTSWGPLWGVPDPFPSGK